MTTGNKIITKTISDVTYIPLESVQAGVDSILRWLPFPFEKRILRDILRNKMIRPTTIPETVEELYIEQAAASGWALGSAQYLADIEQQLGRPVRPRARGRPPRRTGDG